MNQDVMDAQCLKNMQKKSFELYNQSGYNYICSFVML